MRPRPGWRRSPGLSTVRDRNRSAAQFPKHSHPSQKDLLIPIPEKSLLIRGLQDGPVYPVFQFALLLGGAVHTRELPAAPVEDEGRGCLDRETPGEGLFGV